MYGGGGGGVRTNDEEAVVTLFLYGLCSMFAKSSEVGQSTSSRK